MKAVGCIIVLLLYGWGAFGQQELNLVPKPAEVKMGRGNTVMRQPVGFIVYDFEKSGENDGVKSFERFLRLKYNLTKFTHGDTHSYGLPFEIHYSVLTVNKPAGYYELRVEPGRVYIKGSALGKYYAFETLKQLMYLNKKKEITIPLCTIKDHPRFQYRGMHLDVSRHFMPVDLVKRYIDYLAMYKFNTFHWHLTDDQGWRIEIKKYPRLTEVGGWRNGTIVGAYPGTGNDSTRHGGFYTQEQIKEVVRYAAERYINIIPEIELPGHSSAAIAAYPELSCFPNEDTKYPAECDWVGPTNGKQVQQSWGVFEDVFCPTDYTFNFLQDVLDEVMNLFPSKYIHIGGDECPKENWKRSPFCQQLMKEKGLKDARLNDSFGQEHELQSYFIQRIEQYINSKGKKIIGWDEILEGGLAPNATVMSWRGEAGGIAAAKQQHDVIMTPGEPLYLNHSQSKNEDSVTQGGYNPIEDVYNYEPIPKELTAEEGRYILGAQGNVWSEYIDSKSKLEYSIFPRMAALAEVLWTPKEKRNWKDFEKRLPGIMERLDDEKINYSKAYYDLETHVLPTKNFDGVQLKIQSKTNHDSIRVNFWCYENGLQISVPINENGRRSWRLSQAYFMDSLIYTAPITIKQSGSYEAYIYEKTKAESIPKGNILRQHFNFNKATGKKITLSTPAADQYPGDGAFTLVNGVQNTKGISKATEFVGFNGTNCEAIIDLGRADSISKVTVHALNDNGAWVWKPSAVEIFIGENENSFKPMGSSTDFIKITGANGTITVNFEKSRARFVKVLVKNWGKIPAGFSGSDGTAWLFVDEIEVE